MKITKFIFPFLILISFFMYGCTSRDKTESNASNQTKEVSKDGPIINNIPKNEIHNSEIDKRYDTVDKNQLSYNISPNPVYYYETKNNFVGISLKDKIPGIDDKKYTPILQDYTYSANINPTKLSYNDALNKSLKVLPADIKKEREKFDEESGINYIVYSSSKGSFVLKLSCEIESCTNGKYKFNKDIIDGISFFIETPN